VRRFVSQVCCPIVDIRLRVRQLFVAAEIICEAPTVARKPHVINAMQHLNPKLRDDPSPVPANLALTPGLDQIANRF